MRRRGDDVRIFDRVVEQSGGDQTGRMRHVDHQQSPDLVGDFTHPLVIPFAAVSRCPADNHFGFVLQSEPFHGIVVDRPGLFGEFVTDGFVEKARGVDGRTVRKVAAVCEVESHEGVSRLEYGEKDGHIGLSSRVRLYVGILGAEQFAEQMDKFMDLGVQIIGGCCGTTPEYIREMKKMLARREAEGRAASRPVFVQRAAVCSSTQVVEIDGVRVIGERINPTGKKLFKEALLNHNIGYILTQGISQVEAGAHILDVNVGLPKIDEAGLMVEVIKELQGVVDVPLQIDSSHADVIESGLRIYNGKPIVNSVNGEMAVMEKILPLVKKYGAAVVGLTLDEKGIPLLAEERYAVAERIVRTAESYGIPKEDVFIDCLTLTASAQQKEVVETLKAMQLVKERLGVKTVLGVSNISFGLPKREIVNVAFLTLAMAHGLDLPIINPNVAAMMAAIDSFNVLYNRDEGSKFYVDKYSQIVEAEKHSPAASPAAKPSDTKSLEYAVLNGIREYAAEATRELLKTKAAMEIVNEILIPALDKVGVDFESGKLFLPQLIQSATTAQEAFDVLKEHMASQKDAGTVSKGKVIIATVKGDIHDIGKNIVKVVMENYGYEMIDLGKDVPIEKVVEAVQQTGAKLVGLSALMTTTVVSMEETIRALHEAGCDCKIWVGGAVLTEDYAKQIGADFYAKDAKQSVDIAKNILG